IPVQNLGTASGFPPTNPSLKVGIVRINEPKISSYRQVFPYHEIVNHICLGDRRSNGHQRTCDNRKEDMKPEEESSNRKHDRTARCNHYIQNTLLKPWVSRLSLGPDYPIKARRPAARKFLQDSYYGWGMVALDSGTLVIARC